MNLKIPHLFCGHFRESPSASAGKLHLIASTPGSACQQCDPAGSAAESIGSLAGLVATFGTPIVHAVMRDLGRDAAGAPGLTMTELSQADELCRTLRATYAGINFASKLMFSAARNTAEYQVLWAAGVARKQPVTANARARIDQLFLAAFNHVSNGDRAVVAHAVAREMMREAIDAETRSAHAESLRESSR